MIGSLRSLLAESIDYAGMFPPAALPLKVAVQDYARYQRDSAAWMLARFVCPIGRLAELDALATTLLNSPPGRQESGPVSVTILSLVTEKLGLEMGSLPDSLKSKSLNEIGADSLDVVELVMELEEEAARQGRQFREQDLEAGIRRAHVLSLLLTPTESSVQQLKQLNADLRAITQFKEKYGDSFLIDTLEFKLAEDAFASPSGCSFTELLDVVQDRIATLSSTKVFFELPLTDDWHHDVPQVIQAISATNRKPQRFGLKIRTGGVDRSQQLSPEHLAFFIRSCRDAHLFWKATAGLHHPVRQFDADAGVWQFGFLNLLAAATLATVDEIDERGIRNILQDEQPRSFCFGADEFRYNEYQVTNDQIRQARLQSMISFGSCSFEQPRDELRKLGFFPTV